MTKPRAVEGVLLATMVVLAGSAWAVDAPPVTDADLAKAPIIVVARWEGACPTVFRGESSWQSLYAHLLASSQFREGVLTR